MWHHHQGFNSRNQDHRAQTCPPLKRTSLEAGMKSKERKDRSEWSWMLLHQVIRFWVRSINCRMKNFQIYHFRCFRHVLAEFIIWAEAVDIWLRWTLVWRKSVFDTFWRSLSFEPKLSTFGFGEHWSGERIKMVQSMPTLCLTKLINSCSWCHPVSESVRKCCTFRYEMPYSTGIESSATVHGMFRN